MILLTLSRGKGEETVRLQLPASPAEIGETFAFLDRISLDTPVLPMQYDVRIHSIQFDGPCRATASLNINGCFAVRGVKLMEGSNGLFVSMPGQINSKGEIKDICFPYTREARAELESAVVTAYQQALTQGMNRSPQSAPDPTAQQAQKMGM